MDESRRCALAGLVLISLSLGQFGCNLYMHDDGGSKAAKDAKATFSEFAKKSPERYDAMIKNLQRIAVEEDLLVADLIGNTDTARGTLTPTAPFSGLLSEIDSLIEDNPTASPPKVGLLAQFQTDLRQKIVDNLTAEKADTKQITDAAKAVSAAQEQVDAAKANVTNWNATEAVLLKAIESLPDFREKAKASGKDLGEAFGEAATALGDKEVTFHDADGKEVTATVKNLGKDAVTALSKGELKSFPEAPGADLVILNLALDLARIELKRAKLTQQRAEALASAAHDAFVESEVARQILLTAADELTSAADTYGRDATPVQAILVERATLEGAKADAHTQVDAIETAYKTIVTAEQKKQREVNGLTGKKKADAQKKLDKLISNDANQRKTDLQNSARKQAQIAEASLSKLGPMLSGLREAAIGRAMAVRTVKTFNLHVARVAHEDSIADSALNDEGWRVVIAAGLDGLDQYYEGGVRPEDVANLIRLGQAIATGVIAGRVD